MSEPVAASNIVYRIYPAFWMRFCKVLELEIRDIGVFVEGKLIGLNIPIPEDREKFIEEFDKKFFTLQRVSETNDPVRHSVIKQNAYFFDVYYFEGNISIEVNSATNPRLIR